MRLPPVVLLACLLSLTLVPLANAERDRAPGGGLPAEEECPNGETGFESPEECEEALVEQGWTKGANGRWVPPGGPTGMDDSELQGGGGSKALTLSAPGTLRKKRLFKRGVRLRIAMPAGGALKARLLLKSKVVGKVSKKGLAAGKSQVTLKLSKKGRRKVTRALVRRKKVKLKLKAAAGGTALSRTLTVKR